MVDEDNNYDGMISYSHDMKAWVEEFHYKLQEDLELVSNYQYKIFLDKNDLGRNRNLEDSLKSTVESSSSLIVVLSVPYLQSQWCAKELEWFDSVEDMNKHGNLFVVKVITPEHVEILDNTVKSRFEKYFELDAVGYNFSRKISDKLSFPICRRGYAGSSAEEKQQYDNEMEKLVTGFYEYLVRRKLESEQPEKASAVVNVAAGQQNQVILSPLMYLKDEQYWLQTMEVLKGENLMVVPSHQQLQQLATKMANSRQTALEFIEYCNSMHNQHPGSLYVQFLPETAPEGQTQETAIGPLLESVTIELSDKEEKKLSENQVKSIYYQFPFSLEDERKIFSGNRRHFILTDKELDSGNDDFDYGSKEDLAAMFRVQPKSGKARISIEYARSDSHENQYYQDVKTQLYRKFRSRISVKGLSKDAAEAEQIDQQVNEKIQTREDVNDAWTFEKIKDSDYILFIAGTRHANEVNANFYDYEKLWNEKTGNKLSDTHIGAFLIWKESRAHLDDLDEYRFFPYGIFDSGQSLENNQKFQAFLGDLEERIDNNPG